MLLYAAWFAGFSVFGMLWTVWVLLKVLLGFS
jgi:hypothetical protein